MSEVFLKIVNMSISASWIVLAVLLLRLVLKKAPKWMTVLLWGIVAIRLICPFSIESVISLIPSAETIRPEIMMDRTPAIDTGVPIINNIMNPVIEGSFAPEPWASANPLQIWIPVFSNLWLLGIAVMLAYTIISYWRVKRKIGTAVLWRDNIFQSENVVSPFVLGLIKPKIYLPFHMNEQDMDHVIAHENAHIGRKDHLWKPLGFVVLTLHWFNLFIWLGYVLLCRDIELACDEKVVKELDNRQKADYAEALLACSVNRRMIAACPLAFGELGVKDRVKSVLNYRKPAFWMIVVAMIAIIGVAACFLTDPVSKTDREYLKADPFKGENYNAAIAAYNDFLNGEAPAMDIYFEFPGKESDTDAFFISEMFTRDYSPGISEYTLYDMNGDGIPELNVYAYTHHVFSFKDQQVVLLYAEMSGPTEILENGALFAYRKSTGTQYHYTTFDENGVPSTLEFFDADSDAEDAPYSFNNIKVSKQEWENLVKDYLMISEKTADVEWRQYQNGK